MNTPPPAPAQRASDEFRLTTRTPARCSLSMRGLVRRALIRAVFPLLLLAPSAAPAASAERDLEAASDKETDVQLPPFPQDENLIPFVVSANTDNKFLIDGESLSVSPDRVLRFTLVIVSSAGAQTISYEAMRCATAERRAYAFGRSDRTWSKARSDQWTRIQESTVNRHYAALFGDYFCAIGVTLRDAEDARRILRAGGDRSRLRP